MVIYLGSLVQLCCKEGGTLHLWGVLAVSGPHWVCPHSRRVSEACVLSWSTLLRLQVALPGNCLRWALGYMHFPGQRRSGSGSPVLHQGADSVGPAFCALLRYKQLRRPGAWECALPRCSASYHLPGPRSQPRVSWVRSGNAVSGVPCLLWGADLSLAATLLANVNRKTWLATGSLLTVW